MTFYNIIFGLLFLGSYSEVLRGLASSLDAGSIDVRFYQASVLSVLIFSDTIFTSMVIEGTRKRYSNMMKLLDLTSFILLSFAVLVINPTDQNMFQAPIDVNSLLHYVIKWLGCTNETLVWALLASYIVVLIFWNYCGETYHGLEKQRQWLRWVQPIMLFLFIMMAVLTWLCSSYIVEWLRPIILAIVVAYLLVYKPFLVKQLESVITLKPVTASDVQSIQYWPPYKRNIEDKENTENITALDYALRWPGWLGQFPESSSTRRWAAWQDGELVGFAILTEIMDGDAEFYIAVHPERILSGIGKKITQKIIDIGFEQLNLRRIHLKVRTWHKVAIHLYKSIGFIQQGECVENIQGRQVEFITMEATPETVLAVSRLKANTKGFLYKFHKTTKAA